jgi:hypothetical protein
MIWLVVWLQGWLSGFAIQSCLILKNRNAPWLSPKAINIIYIGFPLVAMAGFLVRLSSLVVVVSLFSKTRSLRLIVFY